MRQIVSSGACWTNRTRTLAPIGYLPTPSVSELVKMPSRRSKCMLIFARHYRKDADGIVAELFTCSDEHPYLRQVRWRSPFSASEKVTYYVENKLPFPLGCCITARMVTCAHFGLSVMQLQLTTKRLGRMLLDESGHSYDELIIVGTRSASLHYFSSSYVYPRSTKRRTHRPRFSKLPLSNLLAPIPDRVRGTRRASERMIERSSVLSDELW